MSNQSGNAKSEQVFLSYNHTDRDACIALRSILQQAGINIYCDEETIHMGDRWLSRIEDVLRQCSAFIVLIGRDGVQRWVGAEVQVALNRYFSSRNDAERLPIYPILLNEAKPESLPPFLALFQCDRWDSMTTSLPVTLIEAIKARVHRLDGYHNSFDGCPFLGLRTFDRSDAHLFFGRYKETLELIKHLGDQQEIHPDNLKQTSSSTYTRWLQIEGNSGSGKSSLVNAGMLPMIEQGCLWTRTGFEKWRILGPMMPGKDPLVKLAEVLEHGLVDEPSKRNIDARIDRLKAKDTGLTTTIKDFRQTETAYLLVVDQFEELFTFSDSIARRQFDTLLANALQDSDCPLFLINTIRADFIDRFGKLPSLQLIYNSHCKRYFLPLISELGLREVIEQPARMTGFDVDEIITTILEDAKDEIGALPLVENALLILWQSRDSNNRLSGDNYRQLGGIAGMLSSQADVLLRHIDEQVINGKRKALELLLRLTRINDDGRHTRQRITREEALFIAGSSNDSSGELIIRMLSGERQVDALNTGHNNMLRLITLSVDQGKQYVDLIHETLIRVRNKDPQTGKLIGYWPTLFNYIKTNRNRDIYRQQLRFETEQWQQSKGLGRVWNLAYFDLKKYHAMRIAPDSPEGCFLTWSRRAQRILILLMIAVALIYAESFYWTFRNELPLEMMLTQQRFRFGYTPLPELTEKPFLPGLYNEEADSVSLAFEEKYRKPTDTLTESIQIEQSFYLGKHEVTYEQYDYYVWQQQQAGNEFVSFPTTAKGGRGNRPVVNINWYEASSYAEWLGKHFGKVCRLPTKAEWEYAVLLDKQTSNSFGLQDTTGYVWEWTCSIWDGQHHNTSQQCTHYETTSDRVLLGGAWSVRSSNTLSTLSDSGHPDGRDDSVGFRMLCSSPIHQ